MALQGMSGLTSRQFVFVACLALLAMDLPATSSFPYPPSLQRYAASNSGKMTSSSLSKSTSSGSSSSTSSDSSSSSPTSNTSSVIADDNRMNVSVLVLLPRDTRRMFSIRRTRPVIELAIENVIKMGILPGHSLQLMYADSQCHISEAMNEAIKRIGKVHMYLGPVCDYSLAPVARQAKYWNLPVITSGAMAQAFLERRISLYTTLTRVGTNYQTLVDFIIQMFGHYNYSRFAIVYEKTGQNHILENLCYLVATAMRISIQSMFMEVVEYVVPTDLDHIFKDRIATKFGGQSMCPKGQLRINQPDR